MMGMGFGMVGLLIMLLMWGGLIVLAIWLVSALFPHSTRPAGLDEQPLSALEILDRRYARGELTREQYELMARDISESRV